MKADIMIKVFISYATKDKNVFQIEEVVEQLKLYAEIDEVLY